MTEQNNQRPIIQITSNGSVFIINDKPEFWRNILQISDHNIAQAVINTANRYKAQSNAQEKKATEEQNNQDIKDTKLSDSQVGQ